jgi:outer membrane protein TolC
VTDFLNIPTTLVPGEFFGAPAGTYIPVQFGTKYTASYGVTAEQVLFDGQVFVGLQARKTSIDLRESQVAVTKELIKANVYKIYYQLVIGRKQISTLDANIARQEKLLHDTKAMFENGFQEKLDVDKVNVSLSNLRTEKLKVENMLASGTAGLKYLMGMPMKEQLVLTDTVGEADLKEGILYDSINYADRKEYQLLQNTEKLQKYDIKRWNMLYIPTLRTTFSWSRNAQRNKFDLLKKGEPWFSNTFISFQLSVPIFDGFRKDAMVRQAKLNVQKTRDNIVDLQNRINYEADSSLINLRNALATLNSQSANMTLAEQIYNQTKKKYEAGLGSNLEITNAETELRTAQNNYYAAMYDAIIARIDYLKAVGKL